MSKGPSSLKTPGVNLTCLSQLVVTPVALGVSPQFLITACLYLPVTFFSNPCVLLRTFALDLEPTWRIQSFISSFEGETLN